MIANIIVDALLMIVILIGAILGWKRGFLKMIAKPVKAVAAFAVAVSCAGSFSASVTEPRIGQALLNRIGDYISTKCAEITAENAAEELPTIFKIAAGIFNINIDETVADAGDQVARALVDALAGPAVTLICQIFSGLILFVGCSLLFSLMVFLIGLFVERGVVGVVNRILGVIFSVAFFFIAEWLLVMVFGIVRNTDLLAGVAWLQGFEGGPFFGFFEKFDLVELLLSF